MRTARTLVPAMLLLLVASPRAAAAPGDLDSPFSGDGMKTTDFAGAIDRAHGLDVQPDGRFVAVGQAGRASVDLGIARYRTSGNLDTTFSGDGRRAYDVVPGQSDIATGVAVQGNGRIVVAGYTTPGGAQYDVVLARFGPASALDDSFGGDGVRIADLRPGDTDLVTDVAIQPNGKIVVAGVIANATNDVLVARFLADGRLDRTFSGDGFRGIDLSGGADGATAVQIQADGKIVVGGYASGGAGDDFAVLRLEPHGRLDRTFSADGKRTTSVSGGDDAVADIAIDHAERILATGYGVSGAQDDAAVVRYTPRGALDPSFGGEGIAFEDLGSGNDDRAEAVAVQHNDKYIVAGWASNGADEDFLVARYDEAGALDPSFGGDGAVVTDFGSLDDRANAALISNVKIVTAGQAYVGGDEDFALARYEKV